MLEQGGKENKAPTTDKQFSEAHKKGTTFANYTAYTKHVRLNFNATTFYDELEMYNTYFIN